MRDSRLSALNMSDLETCCQGLLKEGQSLPRLTNQAVLDLFQHTRKHKMKNVVLVNVMKTLEPTLAKTHSRTLSSKITRLALMHKTLVRNKRKDEAEGLLSDEFDIRLKLSVQNKGQSCCEGEFDQQPHGSRGAPKGVKHKHRSFITPTKLALGTELHTAQSENNKLRRKLQFEEMKTRKYSPRVINQKLKRKDQQLQKSNDRLKVMSLINKRIQKSVKKATAILQSPKKRKTKQKLEATKGSQCNLQKQQIAELKSDIVALHATVSDLENQLTQQDDLHVLPTRNNYEKGAPFSPAVRNLCHQYIAAGVAAEHIGPLIHSTISFAGREVGTLPSVSLLQDMAGEVGEVARQQIGEVLSVEKDITLLRDATTKSGHHVQGLLLSSESKGILTVGLKEVSSGTAQAYFEAGIDSLKDIDRSCSQNKSDQLLLNISSTMTDRCIVNKAENRLWNAARDEAAERRNTEVQPLEEFFCSLHPLEQFSDAANKALKKFEEEKNHNIPQAFNRKGESDTHGTLRRISDLFYKDGTGDPLMVTTYLEDTGIAKPNRYVAKILGSRLNISFHNGAGAFFLAEHISNYLNTKDSMNGLHLCLQLELNSPVVLAGCRALGLVGKCLTDVFWSKVVEPGMTILKMAPYIQELIRTLHKLSEDASDLLRGELNLFSRELDRSKSPLNKLIEPGDTDGDTQLLLQAIAMAMYEKAMVLFKDFQPEGRYFDPSPEVAKRATACPADNIGSERLMARFDQSVKHASHSNQSTREAKIMYSANRTADWLTSMQPTERDAKVTQARKTWKKSKAVFKERKNTLRRARSSILQAREANKLKREQNKQLRNEKLLKNLQEVGGLWSTEEELDKNLPNCKSKVAALKVQINARKILLQQEADKSVFAFSSQGKLFTIERLRENLLGLIRATSSSGEDGNFSLHPENLVGKNISHVWNDNGTDVTYYGHVLRYNSKKRELIVYYSLERDGYETLDDEPDQELYDISLDEFLEDMATGNLAVL